MFERFTQAARDVVVLAQGVAAGLLDARGAPSTRLRQAVAQELARGGDSPVRSA